MGGQRILTKKDRIDGIEYFFGISNKDKLFFFCMVKKILLEKYISKNSKIMRKFCEIITHR